MSQSKKAHVALGQFASTAIAGNDILSSALYVSGIAILFAGIYAPLVFVGIAVVLWLYKHVYTEVVEALPLNGGAYNCLLNATSKTLASVAGVMTILSYVATSVISAKTAAEYLHTVFASLPVLTVTGLIVLAFAALVIAGVKDSAKVAMAIFLFHLVTLGLFLALGFGYFSSHGTGILQFNFAETVRLFEPNGTHFALNNLDSITHPSQLLFLAFAASLLGVSGFESSANFVEEQRPGVFRKTLRNMLIGVAVLNPLIALVVLNSMPIPEIVASKDFILANVANILGGNFFQYMLVLDAFLVLSGAVLTSFIGASGLMYRMTLDHCLPSSVLLPRLKSRNAHVTRIVVGFTALCISILILTRGELLSLAGVYTMSFLGVMTLFAIGNLTLRVTRPDLKRTYQGPVIYVILAAAATTAGIIGNILIDPRNILYFSVYFFPALLLVLLMIYRDYVIAAILNFSRFLPFLHRRIQKMYDHVTKPKILVFAHTPEKLYKSLQYILKNETSLNIVVVYCRGQDGPEEGKTKQAKFNQYIQFFKDARIFPKFNLELILDQQKEFNPDTVREYAARFHINLNNIFVGSIHHFHTFSFEELGGVRIIQ